MSVAELDVPTGEVRVVVARAAGYTATADQAARLRAAARVARRGEALSSAAAKLGAVPGDDAAYAGLVLRRLWVASA